MAESNELQNDILMAISTTNSVREAERICRLLVEDRIIACANIIPAIRSFYRWQGQIYQDVETLIIMKTTTDRLPELKKQLPRLHSYEEPELIVTKIVNGLEGYLNWVRDATHPEA